MKNKKNNTMDNISLNNKKKKMSKKKLALIIFGSFIGTLLIAGVCVYFYLINRINYESADDIVKAPSDLSADAEAKVTDVPKLKNDSNIINVLLIGEESIEMSTGKLDSGQRGRSDCTICVSINRSKKTIKLVSFLRDTYVSIPGYQNNKLNAAYQFGGGPLLSTVIEQNYNIPIDGYIRVNFNDFQKIVDALGGVNIELTSKEANYLNHTNYISESKNRGSLKEGTNHMNGNQALGYTRVRKQATTSDNHDDWGRTERQRNVIKAIFNEYKTKSLTDLIPIANELLPLATTNMDHDQLIALLGVALDLHVDELQTLSVPTVNEYNSFDDGNRVTDALQVNFYTLKQKIKDFINDVNQNPTASPAAN